MSSGGFGEEGRSTPAAAVPGPQQPFAMAQQGAQGRNPLLCFVCNDFYSEPCLLGCFHSFCSRCLQGRDNDNKIQCPLCGQKTVLKDGAPLPPPDHLLRQLIDMYNAENPACANCDKRNRAAMYFCHTCGQALCAGCRDNTHRAKMFSTHDVIHMSKFNKEGKKKCATHNEPFIMFSNSQKNMLCMHCFRDTPPESRLQCVDIDTAYTQGCKKLERAVMGVCELQGSVREGMVMFRLLLDELKKNMESEKSSINSFCQGMQEAIAKTHAAMAMEVQRQFETKERMFRTQLVGLASVLPILQMHLLMCTTFSTSATKYEFLGLAYPMMERLTAVTQISPSVRPNQNSNVKTNFRSEFGHALDPWVGPSKQQQQQQAPEKLYEARTQLQGHPPSSRRQQVALRAKAMEGEGPFSNHCRSFDGQLKELAGQLMQLKEQLTSLHKEVVQQRPNQAGQQMAQGKLEHISRDCTNLEETLERHQTELERLRSVFDAIWEEQLCRIHVEQDMFQQQEVAALRSEVRHLSLVARQLEPYIRSLNTQHQQHQQERPPSSEQATPDSAASFASLEPHLQSLLDKISLLQMEQEARLENQREACRLHPSHVSSPVDENLAMAKERRRDDLRAKAERGMLGQLIDKVRTKEERGKKSPGEERPKTKTRTKAASYSSFRDAAKFPESVASCVDVERIETHLKEKLHDVGRSVGRIIRPGTKEEAADYPQWPPVKKQSSCESLSVSSVNSRRSSSVDLVEPPRSASAGAKGRRGDSLERRMKKQHSWETFPPKRGHNASTVALAMAAAAAALAAERAERAERAYARQDPNELPDGFDLKPSSLKKADSFEGHEEAVRTLVAAVQETRHTQQQQQQQQQRKPNK
ncbi:RING finger protein 207-like isoform X2 [Neocloeon triangulifer]|uniref:RING finger protein 207-like isoform X2 n=1 Tax=Neocloeon triangulifer TaxID=2078957 RepID=UPI00286F9B36|nr:RING finger protein 207-like isoform X2 [Neocloeon triangulifer]